MKKVLVISIAIFYFGQIFAQIQNPYELSWKSEVISLGSGAALYGIGLFVPNAETPLTTAELSALDPNDIWAFDRSATGIYSERADHISEIGLYGPTLGGLALSAILPVVCKQDRWLRETTKLGLMWFEMNLLNYGLTEVAKVSIKRIRPLAYNEAAPMVERQDFEIRKSFWSGHTSNSSANMFYIAKVFSDYYPDSKWKPLMWGIAASVPAWTGYLRYKAGRHFPTDVMAGYCVGAVIGFLIPELHKVKIKDSSVDLSLHPYQGGDHAGGVLTITF